MTTSTPFSLPPQTGIMLCGHGSRNQLAVGEFANLAERLRERLPGIPVEYGYLEFANPVIHLGLDRLREQGVKKVLAVPGMLFAAGHAKNDIPSVLNTYAASHDDFDITYGRELGVDLKMIRAAGERIEEAIATAPDQTIDRHETLLMVVGRGSSDPDANSNVAKVMRMIWEGMGFGWGEVSYSGVTFPLVTPALDHAVKLGYRRIIVFPYFLFTGVLVNRIYAAAEEAQAKFPDVEILNAPYLNDHPLVIDTFVERLDEMLVGQNLMNCAMCKYREQVLGFEAEIGMAQESHHHHVEGVGGGLENCPCGGDCDASCRDEAFCKTHDLPWTPLHSHEPHGDHAHSHSHDHVLLNRKAGHSHDHGDHHHHPYPHANHPLGPVTLPKIQGKLAQSQGNKG
ncbi:sirohydrochlorin chelatase [Devosia rhodophyticola]|uniref:Sirohydrochlorin chelatase n=1 Tax=Devosia rhodophyticola TaxID=3026423 RepID=A0ABY7YZ37_9HYPH|nr:sirohydrochlorin chelatase [Devosia rhodophyticola]WDR06596.1 sirohydrochlorin chelatase [Devosia rhodophyticola]